MIKVKATVTGIRQLEKAVSATVKRHRFLSAVAATRTAYDIRDAERVSRQQSFQSPSRYTINAGDYVKRADRNKSNPEAIMGFSEFPNKGTPAYKYLAPNIFGGPRRVKRFERALQAAGVMGSNQYAVPAPGTRRNAQGNLTRGTYTKILSQLRASPDTMQNASNSRRSIAKRSREAIFVPKAGSKLSRGVYSRKKQTIKPLLIFTDRTPTYSKRYPYKQVARNTHRANYLRQWKRALQEYPPKRG